MLRGFLIMQGAGAGAGAIPNDMMCKLTRVGFHKKIGNELSAPNCTNFIGGSLTAFDLIPFMPALICKSMSLACSRTLYGFFQILEAIADTVMWRVFSLWAIFVKMLRSHRVGHS